MLYPWQVITRSMGIGLAGRLPFDLDSDRLRSDLEAVQARVAGAPLHHATRYYSSGFEAIALVAADGDVMRNRHLDGRTFEKTEAMAYCPNIEAFLDGLGVETRRVRLLSLGPGSRIFWHCDLPHTMDGRPEGHVARVHVPIVTNPDIQFQISHQTCIWRPGEVWWGDFSFPHRVANRSTEVRVHMVMDLVVNDQFLNLMPDWFWEQREARIRARRYAAMTYKTLYLYRDYRPRALRRLKWRLIGSASSSKKRAAS